VIRKKDTLELQIDDLAYGGKGVARSEGKVVFVEDGLPGDVAKVFIKKVKPDYCEGRAVEIIKPSQHRMEPICRHFDICGGCRWQNYEYDMQLKYKSEQLKNNLIHIAGIKNPPVEPIIKARKVYYYRNKMEFSFHQDRDGNLLLGQHYTGFYDRVFNIEHCHLQSELSNDIVNFVRDECNRLELPAYHIRNHEGVMRFLVIREGKFTDEVLVNIVTGPEYLEYENKLLKLGKNLSSKFHQLNSILWTINSQKANIAKSDMLPSVVKGGIINGRDHIYEKLGRYKFKISADSFFQTNSYQAQILYDTVIEYAEFKSADEVCDLYCGTGTIAIYISELVKSVTGVESVENAVYDAEINAAENGVNNVKFQAGKVEDILKSIGSFDKVIIDPPRAGMHPKALNGIMEMKPKYIIYVSCNPSTLARDMKGFLEVGYSLDKAVAIDMFPHTYHIESVAKLVLN